MGLPTNNTLLTQRGQDGFTKLIAKPKKIKFCLSIFAFFGVLFAKKVSRSLNGHPRGGCTKSGTPKLAKTRKPPQIATFRHHF